jgi:hypothetical protein
MPEPLLRDRIQALDDATALNALRMLAEQQQVRPDVRSARLIEERIGEAVRQDDVQAYATETSSGSGQGSIARLALINLAGQGQEMEREVEQAISSGIEPGSRLEPISLGLLGAAVLYAFSSEIKLEHQPGSGWSFRFHHRPLKESTTGQLLGELLRLWRPPGR